MPAATAQIPDREDAPPPAFAYLNSSHGLLILVCDAALRFLAAADAANLAGDLEDASMNVVKARRILLELMGALDPAIEPDVTEMLEEVYQRLFDRLGDALDGDRRALGDARISLSRLRNIWLEASRTSATPTRGAFSCLIGEGSRVQGPGSRA